VPEELQAGQMAYWTRRNRRKMMGLLWQWTASPYKPPTGAYKPDGHGAVSEIQPAVPELSRDGDCASAVS